MGFSLFRGKMHEGLGQPMEMNALRAVRDAFPGASLIGPDSVADASPGKGAYALIIHLRAPVAFMLRGLASIGIKEGLP